MKKSMRKLFAIGASLLAVVVASTGGGLDLNHNETVLRG